MAFATVDELASWMQETIPDGDARATLLLDAATAAIQAYTRQSITQATGAVTLNGNGAIVQLLPETPVTAVASVVLDGVTLTADDDYEWDAEGVLYRTNGGIWTRGRRNLVVTYTHGWDPIPPAIKDACLQIAATAWHNPGAYTRLQLGDYAIAFAAGSDGMSGGGGGALDVAVLLDRYRVDS